MGSGQMSSWRTRYRAMLGLGVAFGLGLGIAPAAAQVRTLSDALALTYATNPGLLAARAQLRAIDENVPQALSGWRPQVSISANAGFIEGTNQQYIRPTIFSRGRTIESNALRGANTESLTVTQPLFRGGGTRAGTNRAENQVMFSASTWVAWITPT